MLFDNSETEKAIEAIKTGAKGWTADELSEILRLARARKDPRIDEVSRGAQKRYKGMQRVLVEKKLREQFPGTIDIKAVPVPWLKTIARQDAGVYVVPPERYLEDEQGRRVADDDPRAKLWASVLDRAQLNRKMAEVERRALCPPGDVIVQVVWVKKPGAKVGVPRFDLYWPHDVEVLCHWGAPTSWEYKYVVALRQASPNAQTNGEWWRVWSREPPDDIDGDWGKWSSVVLSDKGEQVSAPKPYPGTELPIFLVRLNEAEGHVFAFDDEDVLDNIDDLNVRRSNEGFVERMQGHDQAWTDDPKLLLTAKGGPDSIIKLMPGSRAELLTPSPKLADMRAGRTLATRELANSRGNSSDAYAVDPGPPLSAVSKRVANIPHDTRVAEQALTMQTLEHEEILPIVLDVVVTYHPEGQALRGLTPKMAPRKPPMIEDPALKQTRYMEMWQAGAITLERVAADLEYYPSVAEARAAIATIVKPPPMAVGAHNAIAPAGAGGGGTGEPAADGTTTTTSTDPNAPVQPTSADSGDDDTPAGDENVAPRAKSLPSRKPPTPDAPSGSPAARDGGATLGGVPIHVTVGTGTIIP